MVPNGKCLAELLSLFGVTMSANGNSATLKRRGSEERHRLLNRDSIGGVPDLRGGTDGQQHQYDTRALTGGKVHLLIRPSKRPGPTATALTRVSRVWKTSLPKPADDIEGVGIKLALYVYISGVDPETADSAVEQVVSLQGLRSRSRSRPFGGGQEPDASKSAGHLKK